MIPAQEVGAGMGHVTQERNVPLDKALHRAHAPQAMEFAAFVS